MHVIFVTRANFRYENFIQVGEIKNPQIKIYYMAQLPHASASQKGWLEETSSTSTSSTA